MTVQAATSNTSGGTQGREDGAPVDPAAFHAAVAASAQGATADAPANGRTPLRSQSSAAGDPLQVTDGGDTIITGRYAVQFVQNYDGWVRIVDLQSGTDVNLFGTGQLTCGDDTGDPRAHFSKDGLQIDLADGSTVSVRLTALVNGVAHIAEAVVTKGEEVAVATGMYGKNAAGGSGVLVQTGFAPSDGDVSALAGDADPWFNTANLTTLAADLENLDTLLVVTNGGDFDLPAGDTNLDADSRPSFGRMLKETPSDAPNVQVTGGVWGEASQRGYDLGSFGATPRLAQPANLFESSEYALRLIQGATVQDVIGTHPTAEQATTMNDAFELLGISNRQIAAYAEASAKGGYDSGTLSQAGEDAQAALVDAGRIRAAVDGEGTSELSHYVYNIFHEKFGDSDLPDPFSINGMIRAVQRGAGDSRQYFSFKAAAFDMIFGSSTVGIARDRTGIFPDQLGIWDTYGHAAKWGRELLGTTQIYAPDAALPDATAILKGSLRPTRNHAAEIVAAAGIVANSIEADVTNNLLPVLQANSASALGRRGGPPSDLLAAQSAAVDKALKAHGVGLTGAEIANSLFLAMNSPTYQKFLDGLPADKRASEMQTALGVLGTFDSSLAYQFEADRNIEAESGGKLSASGLLTVLSSNPGRILAAATSQDQTLAKDVWAQSLFGVARFSKAGLEKIVQSQNVALAQAINKVPNIGEKIASVGGKFFDTLWANADYQRNPQAFVNDAAKIRVVATQTLHELGFPVMGVSNIAVQRFIDGVVEAAQPAAQKAVSQNIYRKADLFGAKTQPTILIGAMIARAIRIADPKSDTAPGGKIRQVMGLTADFLTFLGSRSDPRLASAVAPSLRNPASWGQALVEARTWSTVSVTAPETPWRDAAKGVLGSAIAHGADLGNIVYSASDSWAAIQGLVKGVNGQNNGYDWLLSGLNAYTAVQQALSATNGLTGFANNRPWALRTLGIMGLASAAATGFKIWATEKSG